MISTVPPLKTLLKSVARTTRNETSRPQVPKRLGVLSAMMLRLRVAAFFMLTLLFSSLSANAQNAPTGLTLSLQTNNQPLTNHVVFRSDLTVKATVTLEGSTSTTATEVSITIAGSGIAGVIPFRASDFSITIPAGQSSASANFTITLHEKHTIDAYGDETITVTANTSGLTPISASFTLTDNLDVVVTHRGARSPVTEGDAGTADVTMQIKIDISQRGGEGSTGGVIKQPMMLDYAISGDGVTATDIASRTGTVTIPSDIKQPIFTLPIVLGDTLDEDDESFTITLSNPRLTTTGADFSGDVTSRVTITDDDTTQIEFADTRIEVDEGAGSATFTIALAPLNAFPVTVNYETSDGTAEAGSDYTAITSGSITISAMSASATFSVPVIDDRDIEGSETFTVRLTGTDRGELGTATTATATITNNDPTPYVVTAIANQLGNKIVLKFAEAITNTTTVTDFTVLGAASNPAVSGFILNSASDILTLELSGIILSSEAITLSYNKGSGSITNADGRTLISFTGQVVTVPVSTPLHASDFKATVANEIEMSFAGLIVIENAGPADFAVIRTPSNPSISNPVVTALRKLRTDIGGDKLILTLSKDIVSSDTITLSYVRTRGSIEGSFPAGLFANFSGQAVANEVPADTSAPEAPIMTTPTVTLVNDELLTISGTAEVDSTVYLIRDAGAGTETALGSTTTMDDGAWELMVSLIEGSNTIMATATDRSGNKSAVSSAVTIRRSIPTGFNLSLQKNGQPLTIYSVTEGNFTVSATVTIEGGIFVTDTMMRVSISGSEIAGVIPFTEQFYSIIIPARQTSASKDLQITFPQTQSNDAYGDEVITVTATPPTSGLTPSSASFTLTDNIYVTVNILSHHQQVTEGNTGTTEASIDVRVDVSKSGIGGGVTNGVIQQPLSLDYEFSFPDTATAADVATQHSGTLVIPVGSSGTYTLTLPAALGDMLDEDDEQFTITLRNPRLTTTVASITATDGTISNQTSIEITIVDDDTTQVQFADTSMNVNVNEDAGNAEFTITLIPANALPLTVSYETSDGTASAGSDYTATSGSITISALAGSASFSIPVRHDSDNDESSESFTVTLTDTDRGELGTPIAATATIINKEPIPYVVSAASDASGNVVFVTFSEPVTNNLNFGDTELARDTNFELSRLSDRSFAVVSSFSFTPDSPIVKLNLSKSIPHGESVTLSYTNYRGNIRNSLGKRLANFQEVPVLPARPDTPVISTQAESVNTASFTIRGTAEAAVNINLWSNRLVCSDTNTGGTRMIGSTTAGTNGEWEVMVILCAGANTFTATATDSNGNISDATDAVIITLDTDPPRVVISSTSGGDGGTANTRTLSYTAIFDEAVSGFNEGDITVTGTVNLGSPSVTSFSVIDSRTYTFNVEAISDGSVTVSIAAGVAQDSAGNGNTASNNHSLTIDSTAPGVSITSTPQSVNTESFTLTGTADAGSLVDVLKDGSSIGTTTATANGAWTITVTLTEGVNTFTATATDDNDNTGTSGEVIITLDSTPPTVLISSASGDDGGTANTRTLSYTAIFDEAVNGFNEGDITVTGTAISGSATATVISGFSASADNSTFTFNVVTTVDGSVTVSIAAESAHDIAGNGNTASNNHSLTIDSTAPTVSITTNTPQSVNTESFTLTGGADAGSTVEVFQNGGTIGTTTATNGSWTITVTLTEGVNTLTATATDDNDNRGTSGAVIITLDTVRPGVTITSTSGSNGDTISDRALSYTATFEEAVSGFDEGDITVTGTAISGSATATVISGFSASADNSTFTFNVEATTDGNVRVSIDADVAQDIAGNGNTASNGFTLTIDRTAPSVIITSTPQTVNAGSFTLTGTADAGSTVDVLKDGSTIGTTTATNGTWTLLVTLDEGANTFTATATDNNGNTSDATDAVIITLDTDRPGVTITSTSGGDGGTANTRTLSYTAIFDEAVNGFDEGDITVTGTAISGSATATVISGFSATDSRTYTFNVEATSDGNVIVSIDADVAQDIAGNGNTASGNHSLTIDSTAPSVIITSTPQTVNAGSFTLTGTADAGSTVDVLKDGSTIGTTTATNGTWTLLVTLDEGANTFTASSTDTIGNKGTSGAVIITLDTDRPGVTITSTSGSNGATINTRTLSYTAIFSEAVSGFDEGDITVTGTAISGSATATVISGFSATDSRTYTFNVEATSDGNVIVSIDADVAQDIAGNGNTASGNHSLTIDSTAPSVIITSTPQTVNAGSFTLTGTADAGSTVDVLKDGSTIGTTTATNGTWTLLVTLDEGANTFTASSTDTIGNKGTSGAVIITLDTDRPGVTITSTSGSNGATINTRTLSYTAIFSEAVSGFDEGDITVTGTAISGSATATVISSFSATDSRTYTFNVEATTDGNVIVSIAAGVAQDSAGNGNTASNNHSLTIDSTAPTVSITTNTPQTVNTESFTLTGTAEAGSTVEVFQNGGSIGTTTATNGTWTLLVTLDEGANTFTASSTDTIGNTGTSEAVIITLDTVRPGVTITSTSGSNGDTISDRALSYTAIFTEAVNGFDEGDITVTGTASLDSPAVTSFSATDSRTYTFNVEATSDGNVTVSIAADVAQDIAGNGNDASNAYTLTIDSTAPGVSITSTPQSVNTESFTLTGTAEAGSTVEVFQNGGSIGTTTATANGAWTITVTLTEGVNTFTATATDDNDNTGTSGEVIITLDSTPPTVLISSASGDDGGTANTRTLSYTAIFTEAVSGFNEGDITVTGTAISGSATATVISGFSASADNSTFTFNVVTTVDGSVTVSIAAESAHDIAGNGNTASNNHSLTIDSTAPTVSITTNTPQSVNTESFTLTGGADAGSTVEVFQNGGTIGTTTATNGSWTITVTLTEGVNTLTATATDDNDNRGTSGAVIITLDTVRPGVTITSTSGSNGDTISDRALSYTATFEEAVSGFDEGDITVTGTAISGSATATVISGFSASADNSTFTFNVEATTDGNVRVSIDADVAQDIAGNGNTASNGFTLTIDRTAPSVIITSTPQTVNAGSFTLTGTADAGSTVDVLKDGSTIGTTTATNGTWTLLVTLDEGANTFTATATDNNGNTSDATDAVIITLDTDRPGVTITSTSGGDGGTANTRTLSYTAIFDEAVNGFDEGDITVTGTAISGSATATVISGFSATDSRTYTFNVEATSDGNVIVSIDADVAQDIAGNGNTASGNHSLTIDSTAPSVIITSTPQTVNAGSFTLTGTADAGSTVDVLKDGSTIGTTTATNGTWTLLVTLDEGANTFTASSTDTIGNKGTSGAVIITLDTDRPGVTITSTSGSNGATINTRTLSYTAIFSEAVSGFDEGDITVTGTAISGSATATVISGFSATDSRTYTFNVEATSDGNVIVSIDADVAQDIAGNGNTASGNHSLTIDSTAPSVIITSTPQTVNAGSFTLTGTADAGSTVDVLKDGSTIGTTTATNGTWTLLVTLDEGANTFTASSTDTIGNKGTSGAVIITLDTDRPGVTITSTSGSNGATINTRTLSYTAIFSEAVSGFDEGDITVTGTAISGSATATVISSFSATDSRTYTFNVEATTDGNVIVSIAAGVAQDSAGNGNTASNNHSLTIDSTAPTVSITTNTPQTVNTESFTLTGTAEAGSTVEVFQNGGSIGTTTATGGTWTLLVTLTDGANTFTATATDNNGNTSEATEAVIITLDTVRPGVTISSASGGDGATISDRALSYTAIFTEAVNGFDEGDITVTGTAISGSATATVISGFSATDSRTYTFNVEATSDGNVIVSIDADVAQDIAGNGNTASGNHSLTIDRTAPSVIITSTPQTVNAGSFTLTGTADAGSTVDVLKDGSTIGTTTATNGTWTLLVTLDEGANTFTASSTDTIGNKGTSGAVIITLDTDRPGVTITSTSGSNGATINTRTLSYTAIFSEAVSDFDEGDITVTDTVISGSGTVISGFDATDSRTYTFNAISPADVNVTVSIAAGVAHDGAGNGNIASSNYALTIDSMAPGVLITTSTPQTVNAASFTLTGTADAGSVVDVLKDGSSIGTLTATSTAWTFPVMLDEGVNTFTASSTDTIGNKGTSGAVIITLDTDRPGVTITSTSGSNGATISDRALSYTAIFTEAVNGFDEGDITVTGTAISGSATATVISGFSATDSRTYTFNVEATSDGNVRVSIDADVAQDIAGNGNTASNGFTLTIDSTAPSVSITNTPQSVNAGSFTLTGNAEAGSTVEVFKNGGSIGTETATGGTWTLLVRLTDGANTFTATATDSNGNTGASGAVIITLDSIGPVAVPSISISPNTLVATVGTAIQQITIVSSGGAVESYSIAPAIGNGLSFSTATGAISGTPSAEADLITYVITATNSGGTDSRTITITVNAASPPPRPVITTSTPQTVNTALFTLTGTADAGSTVDVLKDGSTIGTITATNGTWTLLVTLDEGANTFTASSTDTIGNKGTSGAVIITLDTDRPGVTITSTSGSNGATINTRTLSYTAIFSEAVSGFDEGDITVTGTAISGSATATVISGFSATDSRTYTFNVEATSDGNVIVSIDADVAQDIAGNGNTASGNHSLTIDSTAPSVIITSTPQTVNAGSFTLTGTADAGSTVDVLKDGSTIGTTTATNGTWTLLVTLDEGANTFTASSTDTIGNKGTSGAVIITLDTDRPGVTITSTSGSNGATINTRTLSYTAIFSEAVSGFDEGDITVTGTAISGSATATVISSFSATDSRTYTFNVEATTDGNVIVSIAAGVAQDSAGNGNTASNNHSLTIDSTAPTVSITTNTPQTVNTESFTLTGTAEAGSTVDVLKDGSTIGTTTATGGTWTLLVTLTDGANTFTATATDNNGNTSEATEAVIITLDTVRPGVTISSASGGDGATISDRALSYTAIFTEAVNGFDEGDITVTGTAISGSATATVISGFSATDSRTYTFNVEATSDGNVIVSIDADVAQDIAGNGNTASGNHSLTIDRTAPSVIITSTPQTVNAGSFTLTGTADAGSTVDVLKDGSTIGTTTATNGTWTLLVTLDEGANTFTASSTDTIGNKGTSGAVIITLDTDRPGVTITSTSGSNGATINTRTLSYTAIFSEAVSDFDEGDITVTDTVISGSGTVISGFDATDSRTYTFNAISPADVNVTVSIAAGVAHDGAGNGNIASSNYALTIDSMAPGVLITTSTPQTVNAASFTLTGTADAGSVVDVLKDGSSIGTLTATSTAWTFPVMLDEGVNTFTASSTDTIGNKGTSGAVIITLDTDRPGVTITSTSGSNGATISDRALSYTAIFTEAVNGFDEGDITVTGTAISGSATATVISGFSASADNSTFTFNVEATTDGSVTVSIAAEAAHDIAGNGNDASNGFTLTIDSTAPTVSITTNTPQTVNTESFTLTGTAEAGSTVEVFQNGGSIGTETATGGTWTLLVTLTDGANTFTATATDNNGNTSDATDAVIITLDTVRPGVTITSTSGSNGATISDRALSYTAIFTEAVNGFDEGDITVTGTAISGSATATVISGFSATDSRTYTFNVEAISDGSVTVSIAAGVAQDSAGNGNTASNNHSLTIDSTAPTVSITTNTPQSVNTESFTLTGGADAGSTVEVFQNGGTIGTTTATNGSWTITVTLTEGVNTLTATATDDNDNRGTSGAVIITLDTVRPGVTITSTSGSNGDTISDRALSYTATFEEAVSGFDTNDITVTGTASLDSPSVTIFSASADSRTYTFNVEATSDGNVIVSIGADVDQDIAGNGNTASNGFTLTIDSTAPSVSITNTPQSVNAGSFTLTGNAEAGSTVEVFKNGGSIGTETATTNGTWTLLVRLTDGANTFTATATDSNGNTGTSGAVIITLDSIGPVAVPSISISPNTLVATVGTAIQQITIVSSGGAVESYSIAPAIGNGLSFSTATGAISGTPSAEADLITYVITATNSGGTDSRTITITVNAAPTTPTAPSVSIITTPQTVNTASFTLTGTADAGSVVEVLQNGSSVGTETATGGTWTIIVTLDGGANTFTATATDADGNTSPLSDAVIITLEIPEFTNTVKRKIKRSDGSTTSVGVTFGESKTVTVTIRAFTTTTSASADDVITKASNTLNIETAKDYFEFISHLPSVVKVDLLENAIVDIVITDAFGYPVPDACSVDSPCKVSLSYTDADLERLGDISAEELVVFHYTNDKWTELKSFVDPDSPNTIVGETTSFSPFVLGRVDRYSTQFHRQIIARFTQALVANVARTVEGRVGAAFSDARQLASYQLDGQTVQLNGSDNLQDSMMNKLPHYAKALKDGGMDWKAMLSRSSFVLPLNTAGNLDSEQSGMTLWGRGDYTKLSGKSGGLDWNGSLVGFQVGIDSRIRDDLLVGGLVSFGNGKTDYTDNRTDGAYKLKNMTGVHPYMAWTNGDMSLWGSVGYGQGRAEVSTGNVTSKVSMLSLSGGVKGKLSQTGLSLKGDISLVRTDVENTIKVDNNQRLRLVLESERQRTLASGGTITPVLEAGLRYDSGDGESGLGAVLGAGIRHNLDGWVVKGKVHAVVGQNNYQEWGIHGTIEKAPNVNQQGLSFSVNPSYGATDIRMQQVYGRDQTSVSNNGTSNDYAMRLNARMDYGLSVSGIRGMLIPYSKATLGGQSKDYELGINWKRHSAFNINLSVERETRGTSNRILLESKVQF